MLRRLFYLVVFLAALTAPAYYWLIMESHMPSEGTYSIDIAEVRRLADSLPGDKPAEVRVETVAISQFPKTAVVAGDGWESVDIPISAYQLVYPDRTVVIDSGLDEASAKSAGLPLKSFDTESFKRLIAGLSAASLILITHEHADHVGGLFAHPDAAKVLAATRLTKEQFDNPDRMVPIVFPDALRAGYRPMSYDRYAAAAPGVVLIKAPGHSPGSQMIYVRRADGKEILFLGDVAWQIRNIDVQRERARLMTWWFIREDRDAVMLQLAELKRLREANPSLEIMPGHDPNALAHFLNAGLLVQGFK
jgi:glyoxylase-like metal-dependent hydrolase (beta-lactamase superfamily II)